MGVEGAEHDHDYLEDCYYDHGDLTILRDTQRPECIVVGRTGSGKTALLIQLAQVEEHTVVIEPEELSLQYLSNSTILPQLESLGVNLGLFYKLLWRHIFAVELIKAKYDLKTEAATRSFRDRIWDVLSRDKQRERSIDYLRRWGEEFWKDTEYRVREVTRKLEDEVKASLGTKFASVFEASLSGTAKQAVEEKADVVQRLQEIVNSIQVRDLNNVIAMLGESVFDSPQPRFYVILDKLDENWVEDRFRYKLIKALVESVNQINLHMKGVKIIIALRRDLLDHVINMTRDPGFQEEKYEALFLTMRWTKAQLFDMLNIRVNKLVRRRYSGGTVVWTDLMPNTINNHPATDFLADRTMYRPRDLIVFFNLCIGLADGRPEITGQTVLQAEGEYSRKRIRSLYDEWHIEFPELEHCCSVLKGMPPRFKLEDLALEVISELCLALATSGAQSEGVLREWATAVTEEKVPAGEMRARMAAVFYRVGIVGLKLDAGSPVNWSFLHAHTITTAAIRNECGVQICPVFFRALGITPTAIGR